jgi:hypothetical protein
MQRQCHSMIGERGARSPVWGPDAQRYTPKTRNVLMVFKRK